MVQLLGQVCLALGCRGAGEGDGRAFRDREGVFWHRKRARREQFRPRRGRGWRSISPLHPNHSGSKHLAQIQVVSLSKLGATQGICSTSSMISLQGDLLHALIQC